MKVLFILLGQVIGELCMAHTICFTTLLNLERMQMMKFILKKIWTTFLFVESEFGYHIMFYSSNSATIYRNMLIENALRSNDTAAWYQALVESCTITEGNTKYLSRNMKLSTSN